MGLSGRAGRGQQGVAELTDRIDLSCLLGSKLHVQPSFEHQDKKDLFCIGGIGLQTSGRDITGAQVAFCQQKGALGTLKSQRIKAVICVGRCFQQKFVEHTLAYAALETVGLPEAEGLGNSADGVIRQSGLLSDKQPEIVRFHIMR